MKEEFNFQGLNKARTALKIAALALPALWATGQFYGAQGMAAFTTLTTMLTIQNYRRFDRQIRNALSYARPAAATPPNDNSWYLRSKDQIIGDAIAARFGLAELPVYSYSRKQSYLAFTDGYHVHLSQDLSPYISPRQTAWIVAHEADHIKNLRDEYLTNPLYAASYASIGWGAFVATVSGLNIMDVPGNPSALSCITVSAGAALLLHLSACAVNREIEYRCDANALRATRDLDAAKATLRIIGSMQMPFTVDTWTARQIDRAALFFALHPSNDARQRNLDKTWAAMRKEMEPSIPASPYRPSGP